MKTNWKLIFSAGLCVCYSGAFASDSLYKKDAHEAGGSGASLKEMIPVDRNTYLKQLIKSMILMQRQSTPLIQAQSYKLHQVLSTETDETITGLAKQVLRYPPSPLKAKMRAWVGKIDTAEHVTTLRDDERAALEEVALSDFDPAMREKALVFALRNRDYPSVGYRRNDAPHERAQALRKYRMLVRTPEQDQDLSKIAATELDENVRNTALWVLEKKNEKPKSEVAAEAPKPIAPRQLELEAQLKAAMRQHLMGIDPYGEDYVYAPDQLQAIAAIAADPDEHPGVRARAEVIFDQNRDFPGISYQRHGSVQRRLQAVIRLASQPSALTSEEQTALSNIAGTDLDAQVREAARAALVKKTASSTSGQKTELYQKLHPGWKEGKDYGGIKAGSELPALPRTSFCEWLLGE